MNKAPKLIDQITADLIAQDGLTPDLAHRVAEVWIRDDLLWEDKQIRIDFILASAELTQTNNGFDDFDTQVQCEEVYTNA